MAQKGIVNRGSDCDEPSGMFNLAPASKQVPYVWSLPHFYLVSLEDPSSNPRQALDGLLTPTGERCQPPGGLQQPVQRAKTKTDTTERRSLATRRGHVAHRRAVPPRQRRTALSPHGVLRHAEGREPRMQPSLPTGIGQSDARRDRRVVPCLLLVRVSLGPPFTEGVL